MGAYSKTAFPSPSLLNPLCTIALLVWLCVTGSVNFFVTTFPWYKSLVEYSTENKLDLSLREIYNWKLRNNFDSILKCFLKYISQKEVFQKVMGGCLGIILEYQNFLIILDEVKIRGSINVSWSEWHKLQKKLANNLKSDFCCKPFPRVLVTKICQIASDFLLLCELKCKDLYSHNFSYC